MIIKTNLRILTLLARFALCSIPLFANEEVWETVAERFKEQMDPLMWLSWNTNLTELRSDLKEIGYAELPPSSRRFPVGPSLRRQQSGSTLRVFQQQDDSGLIILLFARFNQAGKTEQIMLQVSYTDAFFESITGKEIDKFFVGKIIVALLNQLEFEFGANESPVDNGEMIWSIDESAKIFFVGGSDDHDGYFHLGLWLINDHI
jgi:hypothetical protein